MPDSTGGLALDRNRLTALYCCGVCAGGGRQTGNEARRAARRGR